MVALVTDRLFVFMFSKRRKVVLRKVEIFTVCLYFCLICVRIKLPATWAGRKINQEVEKESVIMGAFFAVATKRDCVEDLFFGLDYHSHLGTKYGGMVVFDEAEGFQRQIHSISKTPFRTKFGKDILGFKGNSGIGCISDTDPQPLMIRSHLGFFAITTVGIITNSQELVEQCFDKGKHQFTTLSSGEINTTELVATLINRKSTLVEGIRYAQDVIKGSMTMIIMTDDGRIIAARDKVGRLPIIVFKNEAGYCATFESFAAQKLGFEFNYELGPQEIVSITADGVEQLSPPGEEMKVCAFLWTYYGYPSATYEGKNVEIMRCDNGRIMARDERKRSGIPDLDYVAGVPDSGTSHAIGYANESGVTFARPFIKYTPTWSRSFMPTTQNIRNQVAKMKQIPVHELIKDKKLLFVDDSIVRGTQLRETVDFLYKSGAKAVHMRSACPPIMYGCKYLNFSASKSEQELIARRIITDLEGDEGDKHLEEYADVNTERGKCLLSTICKKLGFDSLGYQSLDGLLEAIGLDRSKVCTYCWNGKE